MRFNDCSDEDMAIEATVMNGETVGESRAIQRDDARFQTTLGITEDGKFYIGGVQVMEEYDTREMESEIEGLDLADPDIAWYVWAQYNKYMREELRKLELLLSLALSRSSPLG